MSTNTDIAPAAARHGYPPLSALRRSRSDRKVVGVAGGLGRYAGIDPLVFRILFVALTVFGGSGLLLYALGWLLVPEDGETESEGQRLFRGSSRRSSADHRDGSSSWSSGLASTGTSSTPAPASAASAC